MNDFEMKTLVRWQNYSTLWNRADYIKDADAIIQSFFRGRVEPHLYPSHPLAWHSRPSLPRSTSFRRSRPLFPATPRSADAPWPCNGASLSARPPLKFVLTLCATSFFFHLRPTPLSANHATLVKETVCVAFSASDFMRLCLGVCLGISLQFCLGVGDCQSICLSVLSLCPYVGLSNWPSLSIRL